MPAHKTPSMSPESGRHATYTCGAVFTLCTLLLYLYEPTLLRYLDNRLYDMLLRSAAAGQTTGVPVIVDLDEKAFAQFGQWPWPRYRIALLLEKLRELAPATVGLDMVFAEADRTSFGTLQEEILRDLKIHVKLSGLPTALVDNDKMLAGVLSRGSFVLGYRFSFANEQPPHRDCVLHPMNLVTEMPTEVPPGAGSLFMAQDAVCNLRVLSEAAPASGFFNVAPDFDGILRRVPLLMIHDGRFYPSLSLAAFMHTFGTNQVTLKVTSRGVDSLRLRNVIIPLDARGNLLVRFRGKGRSFTYVSAGDVLTDRIPKSQIQGKIVFLGTSAAALGESRPTPVDAVFPGVEVHATIVDNILKNEFVSRPNWVPGLELFLVVAMGGLSTLLLGWTGAAWSLSVLALGALGLWQASHWALHTKGIFLSPLIPLISLAGNFSLLTLCKYWREERKARARTREIARIQDFTILCLASLTETRHNETGRHILRTQRYVESLCRRLASSPRFRGFLDAETTEHLCKSAPLHDIGKVGVPDSILLKPARLSPDEFEEAKKHTVHGRDAIQKAEAKFGGGASSSFLLLAKEIAYTHHEKWDGSGYPEHLKGENIPVAGRIMALADMYDALTSRRVYKPALPHEEAVLIVTQQRGTAFDPDVVDAFLAVHEEFRQIALELADPEEQEPVLTPRTEARAPCPVRPRPPAAVGATDHTALSS